MGDYYDIDDADDADYYRRVAAAEQAHRDATRAAAETARRRSAHYRATGWLCELAMMLAAWGGFWCLLAA